MVCQSLFSQSVETSTQSGHSYISESEPGDSVHAPAECAALRWPHLTLVLPDGLGTLLLTAHNAEVCAPFDQ